MIRPNGALACRAAVRSASIFGPATEQPQVEGGKPSLRPTTAARGRVLITELKPPRRIPSTDVWTGCCGNTGSTISSRRSALDSTLGNNIVDGPGRSPPVQEPAARRALLFGVQYGLQPISARPSCTRGPQLSPVMRQRWREWDIVSETTAFRCLCVKFARNVRRAPRLSSACHGMVRTT